MRKMGRTSLFPGRPPLAPRVTAWWIMLLIVALIAPAASATDPASHAGQSRSFEEHSDGYLCLCAVIKASKANDQVLNAVWRSFIQGDSNYCGARSDDNPSAPGCVLHVFTIFPASSVCAEHKLLNPGAGIFSESDRDRASFVATKCATLVPKALNPLSPQWVR